MYRLCFLSFLLLIDKKVVLGFPNKTPTTDVKTTIFGFPYKTITTDVKNTILGFPYKTPTQDNAKNVCCMPNSWEAKLLIDSGTVFIDSNTAFAYFNGTVHAAYSLARQKLLYNMSIVEQSPLIPHPYRMNRIILADYTMGVTYSVSNGECDKVEIGKVPPKACIPLDATLLSKGEFGDVKRPLETYQYTTDSSDTPYQITVSVFRNMLTPIEPTSCMPFHATYFTPSVNPDSGTMYTFDVVDMGAIKSNDIFDIPEPCRHLV